jgi:phage protein D
MAESRTTSLPPGTQFFAPQARLVDPDDPGRFTVESPADVDLISARVTQVHNGVSQVSITLNNQRHHTGRPVHPPWKYNGLDRLRFGQRIRVDFRYAKDTHWSPLILARITDIKFTFPATGGATVTLQGEDLLSLLKTKPTEDKRYRNQQELAIVDDVLRRSGAGLTLAPPLVPRPALREPLRSITHQKSKTYLQFLQELGEPLDYEVFVDFDDPTDENATAVRLHFEPARSLALRGIVDVAWGQNLIEFQPVFKVWEQFTEATALGRHPSQRRRIEERVAVAAVTEELHPGPDQAQPLDAIAARRRFFGGETGTAGSGDNAEAVDVSNLDSERARLKATSTLRKRAREFLTAEAATIGFPRLRPGLHASLTGFYAPFDGIYYVTKCVHTLDASGYKTQFSLRRPGMLPPEGYPPVQGASS